MTTVEPPPLAPLYYLDNFERLCATVQSQYADLLTDYELTFLQRFESADRDARCLYTRLVSRRGPIFRREQLQYPELESMDVAVTACIEAGLLTIVEEPVLEELLGVLRKTELLAIYRDSLQLRAASRKDELVTRILCELSEQSALECWRRWRGPQQHLLLVEHVATVEVLQLLFFGNRRQSLTDFVLSDLGIARFHPYPLDREFRLFTSRAAIDTYLQLSQLSDRYRQAREEGDRDGLLSVASELMAVDAGSLLKPRRDRLCNRVARQLERIAEPGHAVALYCSSDQHPARERRIRILSTAGEYDAALELCDAVQDAPYCESEVDFARRQLPTLHKRLGLSYEAVQRDRFVEDQLALSPAASVEHAAARYYAEQWSEVYYVENVLVNASFGLALWEQIFAAVPGAFVNPFQAAPMDMYSREFYLSRKTAIDRRLAMLDENTLATELLTAYDQHLGVSNRWVAWRGLPRQLLASALACIPAAHWQLLWRRILFDPEANRSGFPDLLALDPAGRYCLIEVKGPGDQLQLNQRRWLRFFQANDIPAQVARVSWLDA